MKISKYAFFFVSTTRKYLVYNSISNSFAELNEELYTYLLKAKNNPNIIDDIDEDTLNSLRKSKIITTDEEELNHRYMKRLTYYSVAFSSDYLDLTITPTTNCNFSCPYCYEEGIKPKSMSENTIEDIIKFIKKNKKTDGVYITWYGGEPLLKINLIKLFIDRCKEEKIKILSQNIITNGYNLNSKAFDLIINNFNSVQITIDGATKERHNDKRYTKNREGTWDIILSNLDIFLNLEHEISIAIRCNIYKNESEEFYKLKELLTTRWNGDQRVTIYPGIIDDITDLKQTNCNLMGGKDISDFNLEMSSKYNQNIYPKFDTYSCGAMYQNAYVIGTEGELYKCWNDLGHEDKIIGSIYDDNVKNPHILAQYLAGPSNIDDKTCIDCTLFFVCNGGCIWKRIKNQFEKANFDICNNKKHNIEKYLENYYDQKKQK